MSRSRLPLSKILKCFSMAINVFFLLVCSQIANGRFYHENREESEGKLKGILGYVDEDLVSTDFVGDSR